MPPPLAVVPGEDQNQKETDDKKDVDAPLERCREAPRVSENLNCLEDQPCSRQIGQNPVDEPSLSQTVEEGEPAGWKQL